MSANLVTDETGQSGWRPASTAGVIVGLFFLAASGVLALVLARQGSGWAWDTFVLVASAGLAGALIVGLVVSLVFPPLPWVNLRLWRRPTFRDQTLRYPELTILDHEMRVRIVLLKQAENLMQFYQSCGRIYDEVARTL